MVFINTWVYSKKDTLDIHTGWWSLVNCWWEGSYETLYNVLMNINQMAVGLTAGRSDGSALLANRCINVIPRQSPGPRTFQGNTRTPCDINITCTGNSYPSTKASVSGCSPKDRTKSATCKLNEDGKTANWDLIYKCVPGNVNINTSDAILVQW